MKIALVQSDIVWGDVSANCEKLRAVFQNTPGCDLYILPEMFSTGFNGVCEKSPSVTLGLMKEMADQHNCAIAGSLALELENGDRVNRFYFVKPGGDIAFYDKKHLFSYAGEHNNFRAGDARVTVSWRSLRFLLLVCYDLRFPVWARNRGDYDVILCVASWPEQRRQAWDSLLKARAIENQCYVAAVNRVGKDPSCVYNGGSVLLDMNGGVVGACADSKEDVVVLNIDKQALEDFRMRFPFLQDADDFVIK